MTEPAVTGLIGVAEAIEILDQLPVYPRIERHPLGECRGLRLAEDIRCDRPFPPFDKAVMDGYAVRSADVSVDGKLRLIDTVAAGEYSASPVQAGEAIAIMTGAPLPAGADAVVPIEQTSRSGDQVRFDSAVRPGQAVAGIGSDRAAGEVIARAGDLIGPALLGALAAVGEARPRVFSRPRVALLPTGDELIAIDRVPSGAQIRNSNAAMLAGLLQSLGCEVVEFPPCPDDPDRLRHAIETGLTHDALFVTGGMSMGERDFVPRLFNELGLERRISKLRIKPGKPFVLAADQRRIAFGLPGNPVSAFLCTLRLASRVLSRMRGGRVEQTLPSRQVVDPLPANGPREFYLPATFTADNFVRPLPWKGSADLFTLASADVFIVRTEGAPAAAAGNVVSVLPIRNSGRIQVGSPLNSHLKVLNRTNCCHI